MRTRKQIFDSFEEPIKTYIYENFKTAYKEEIEFFGMNHFLEMEFKSTKECLYRSFVFNQHFDFWFNVILDSEKIEISKFLVYECMYNLFLLPGDPLIESNTTNEIRNARVFNSYSLALEISKGLNTFYKNTKHFIVLIYYENYN